MPHLDAAHDLARWLVRHDAEDVVQEVFLRALQFVRGFQGESGRAWHAAIPMSDEKHPGLGLWITIVVAEVLLYFASYGQYLWFHNRFSEPEFIKRAAILFFEPATWLYQSHLGLISACSRHHCWWWIELGMSTRAAKSHAMLGAGHLQLVFKDQNSPSDRPVTSGVTRASNAPIGKRSSSIPNDT
jgi:hypothetical protein